MLPNPISIELVTLAVVPESATGATSVEITVGRLIVPVQPEGPVMIRLAGISIVISPILVVVVAVVSLTIVALFVPSPLVLVVKEMGTEFASKLEATLM